MKRTFRVRFSVIAVLFLVLVTQSACQFIDTGGLSGVSGSTSANFAGGVSGSIDNNMAKGVIKSAENSLGLFMKNSQSSGSLENARLLASGSSIYGDAYMAVVQEDMFYYARMYNKKLFNNGKDVDTVLLNFASRSKVLLSLYSKEIYLLVNTTSFPKKYDAAGAEVLYTVADLSGKLVNIGPIGSDTAITASTVLDANGISAAQNNGTLQEGIDKVISGTFDAAFLVDNAPSSILSAIPASAPVKLVKVTMPTGSKHYAENGIITPGYYPFVKDAISGNAQVSEVLIAGPKFDDSNVEVFLKNIIDNASDYSSIDKKWSEVSISRNSELIIRHPQMWNYRALCYLAGFPRLTTGSVQNGFYSGYADSVSHSIAVELIWLLSHNTNVDLKEQNSTGGWENAYRLVTGSGSMALITDGIFSSLIEKKALYESVICASMKKIVPMNEEFVHLVVNKTLTTGTDISSCFGTKAAKTINVGPKTSGTFIAAVKIMNSYGFTDANLITYCYDSESDGVAKVGAGTYTAAFVTSSTPYPKFYSHDTYLLTDPLNKNLLLIPALFNGTTATSSSTTPFPYRVGTLAGNGSSTYENYPYSSAILPYDTIKTTVVRGMLVASPVFASSATDTFIKSIFRFAQYETEPTDPDYWKAAYGYQPNFPWISVRKETITQYRLNEKVYISDTMIGAREYFINDPFGWNDQAADYYLTMF